jgi:hypothetical protein
LENTNTFQMEEEEILEHEKETSNERKSGTEEKNEI